MEDAPKNFSIEGTADIKPTEPKEPEKPKLMDRGIVAERVRRLLKLPPKTVPTLEQLESVPANQAWKVEEARLKAQARGERMFEAGKGGNRAQRRA